ncbi:glutathione hydrolase 6 isoform X1 [Carcharodon carcharias]|uniref:glutathione hydrolase 6 isoform X1 n=1 Tax=Carcharodon carcharias TaxID=13397 RepID=UPI001B7E2F4D|nr:glutathione hydrolase 6 isoform X1 [Carcharodon carcharias]
MISASGVRYQRVQAEDWNEEEEEEGKVTINLYSASTRSSLSRQKRESCVRITASVVLLSIGLYFALHVLRNGSLEAPGKGSSAKDGKAHHGEGHHHHGNKGAPAHHHEHGVYHHAAVITDSETCSSFAKEVLTEGGTVVDAGIVAMLCLGVVHPHSAGIGGVLSAVFYNKTLGTTKALSTFPVESLNLSYGIPSTLQGLRLLHHEFGSLSWAQLFQRPLELARNGFLVDNILAGALREAAAHRTDLCPLLCSQGWELKAAGANATNRKLASVLEKVSAEMEEATFPESLAWRIAGDVPKIGRRAFVEAVIRQRATLVEPLVTELDHFFLYVAPPPASGEVLTRIVKRAGQLSLSLVSVSSAENASAAYQGILNAAQQAYQSLPGFPGPVPWSHQKQSKGKPSMQTAPAGSQVTVIDVSGNVLAMVSSLNSSFGAKVLSPSTGIFLSDFTERTDSGVLYWACPAVLRARAGDGLVAIASAGGTSAPFAAAQVVLNKVYFERSAREALSGPRFYLNAGVGGILHKLVSGLQRDSKIYTLLLREEPELELVNGTAGGVTATVVESHLGHISAFGQPQTYSYADGY